VNAPVPSGMTGSFTTSASIIATAICASSAERVGSQVDLDSFTSLIDA
jgi:hypothetical protein